MAKVLKTFRDKYTKKIYKKGDSYIHKDEKRIAFLAKKGFLEKEEIEKEDTKETKKGSTRKKASE